jgi:hypothetical protein
MTREYLVPMVGAFAGSLSRGLVLFLFPVGKTLTTVELNILLLQLLKSKNLALLFDLFILMKKGLTVSLKLFNFAVHDPKNISDVH